jgi:glutamyl endopeptidase
MGEEKAKGHGGIKPPAQKEDKNFEIPASPVSASGGDTWFTSTASPTENVTLSFSETEVEDVSGFAMLKPGEGDKEVSNQGSLKTETSWEDPGYEGGLQQRAPLDALYASYSALLPHGQIGEIIIGEDKRVRVDNTVTFPWRAICSLRITAQNNTTWAGTGWLVGPRTVITAGHCVFLHDQGGWVKSIEVIPGMNGAQRPYSAATSSDFRSVQGWTQAKNRHHDYGAIILPPTKRLGDATGYLGFAVRDDQYLANALLNLSGYPVDKVSGSEQWFSALNPKAISSSVIAYDTDLFGGQSGAPLWAKVGEARYCVGIHTNGHTTGNSATRITTPVFNNIQSWKNIAM